MRKNITIEEAAQEVQGRSQAQETLRRLLKNLDCHVLPYDPARAERILMNVNDPEQPLHPHLFTTMTRILLD